MRVVGCGLHSGRPVTVTLARGDGPVRVVRGGASARIDELTAVSTDRGTTVDKRGGGLRVATVEHLFAALAAARIARGLTITLDAEELPLLDGGARAWCDALAVLAIPPSPPELLIARTETIEVAGSRYFFSPGEAVDVTAVIDFGDPRLEPVARWAGDTGDFSARIATARTFALARDVPELADRGLASHVTPESVVLVAPDRILCAGAPFLADEPARHKLLDLIGDMYLYGGPPRGTVRATLPGHTATHAALTEAAARGIFTREEARPRG